MPKQYQEEYLSAGDYRNRSIRKLEKQGGWKWLHRCGAGMWNSDIQPVLEEWSRGMFVDRHCKCQEL